MMRLLGVLLSASLLVGTCECIIGGGILYPGSVFSYFHCDGGTNLDVSWRCDGTIDCNDQTDERDCDYENCDTKDPTRFFCKFGKKCILQEFVCDGRDDCPDRSDESNCNSTMSCPSEFFACEDGSNCIPRSFMCDGHPECLDKSDETKANCNGTLHGYRNCMDKFTCGFGLCLEDDKFVCDGEKNCPDGRDESAETCSSHPDCKDCSQLCKRHRHGVTCGCNTGYELAKDDVTCNDVDECARGFCSQNCHNSKGSFECSCRAGFKKINETRCENLEKATFVWYQGDVSSGRQIVLLRDGKERKIRIPDSDEHMAPTVMPPMAFDIDKEKLYIRVGNTLYSMEIRGKRNTKPTLVRVLAPHVQMTDFAVDYATGNVYFTTMKGTGINICDTDGSCFPYVARRTDIVSRIQIARLTNGTKLFWKEGSQIMSGSLDASEYNMVFKVFGGETIRYFLVDEQSEKMYVVLKNLVVVDLVTSKTRVLTPLDYGLSKHLFWNMAVHDDVILVQVVDAESVFFSKTKSVVNKIFQIDRLTGDHLGPLQAPAHRQLHSVHHTSKSQLWNPCSKNKCTHICAPGSSSSRTYECLCPPGMRLDDGDNHSCVLQEGEEIVYFVNGTSVSMYVYEDDELYLNSKYDLNVAPLAIATTLDMNLIYSTQLKLYEMKRDGPLRVNGVRGIRAMVVDPVDDVLYAANEYELLAVNLRTLAVALIRNSVDIKHLDIDPLNRILYAESADSKLYSMEIGSWELTRSEIALEASNDGQKTWTFDPSVHDIQSKVSLVLEKGYCDLIHDDQRGFDCHRRGWLAERCTHSEHETRLLARAGRPLVPLKGTACGTTSCEFCVSARGNNTLEPVCVCPYGHELGADGVSCSKTCGPQMRRCSSGSRKCIHESRRCDGVRDCSDGSDEMNCNEHDCGENFKCRYKGNCISKRFHCDGNRDCSDGSDEENCPVRNCTAGQFKCEDGACISMTKRCDETVDCYHGDDERDCPKVACKKNQFQCGNGRCISKEWLCDSRVDCPNGEDEAECPSLMARLGKLPQHKCDSKWIFCCGSGEQVPASMRCNGLPECLDRSDEKNCNLTCAAPRFLCDNGACLQESEVCDGIPHCPNKADEHHCRNKCSKNNLFECRQEGTCIPQDKVCNGEKDCSDGSDESDQKCVSKPPVSTKPSCTSDEFRCRSGQCIPSQQVCDDKPQCADGTDEGSFCKGIDCEAAGCSQSCYSDDARRVRCSCHKGYRLSNNGFTCNDIDECAEAPQVCSQFCKNLKGSYECSCAEGFIENARGECRVESGDPITLIVESGVVEAIHKNKDRNMLFNSPGANIGGIEYDAAAGLVFVSDTDNDKIHRIPLNEAHGEYKHESYTQLKPGPLAFDWVAGNLYFADHRPSIHVCNRSMAGAPCRIMTDVNIKPVPGAPPPAITSIALVPDEGIMFYSEASTGLIFRQNMDGTGRSPFSWAAGEKRPLSLTVDHVHRSLYWIDARSGSIETSNLKGEKIRRIASHLSFVKTFAIFEDNLLLPEPSQENLIVMDKRTGRIKSSESSHLGSVSEVKIMHQVNQPVEINRCFRNQCQQMCLLKPHGYTCACMDGQELSEVNQTCVKTSIDDSNLIDVESEEKLRMQCPCLNGGTCTAAAKCKCPAGFHGDLCELGPAGSSALTVFLICVLIIIIAGGGVYLMILTAKMDRRRKEARAQEGNDRLTLIEKDQEGDY